MKKEVKLFVVLALVFVVCLFYNSCKKEEVAKNNKIVVGIHSWPGNGPIYIGDEKDFFKEKGIELEIQRIESFDSRRASLVSKQIDIDCTTLDQLLILWDSGFEAQVFGISDFSTGGDGIIAKKEIKSLSDLRGKTVAYAEASPSDFFLRYLLRKEGISINELILQPVADAPAAGMAILAERVDAAVTFEPWLSESKKNRNLHIIASTTEYPNLIPGIYMARKDDLSARKNLFRNFMQAWYRSVEYFINNPEPSKEILVRRMGLSMEDLEAILSTITILDKDKIIRVFDRSRPQNMYEITDAISEFWKESGFITKIFNAESLLLPLVE